VWNVLMWHTRRRVTRADVRQVWVPGVCFGLAIAVLFGGVTRNSVANAALIGALAPFLIVPVGAWLFSEYFSWPAIAFAVIAFGGVALVLLSAPPGGDATLAGNVFAVIAMLLMVAYVTSTRHRRGEMDVTRFMATISPIAVVAVVPIAAAQGDVFGMSARGWVYTAILTLTSGMTAQGLLVYAQKTVQIGTIGVAQQVQPALAVVWSFLLLGELINARQAAGIAIVILGLTAFVVAQQRGARSRQRGTPLR
jgi:drug/metabolite transporter (DMT)-like permease